MYVLVFSKQKWSFSETLAYVIYEWSLRNLPAAAHSPKFVATQSPTSKTINDFWTMVWQESTEIIICLLHELDYVYWPKDRKEPFKVDPDLEITLQSTKTEPGTPFVERIFTLSNTVSHTSRVVIHLQLMPAQFAIEVCSRRLQIDDFVLFSGFDFENMTCQDSGRIR